MKTKEKILRISKELIQELGSNGFSYQDIANKLKIKKASIHYYFPQKKDLLLELVLHYKQALIEFLDQIDREEKSVKKKLERYLLMYQEQAKQNKQICLCGVLAGEIMTLPKNLKREVQLFFEVHENWLRKIIDDEDQAREIVAALQGALVISRLSPTSNYMESTIRSLKTKN